MKNVLNVAFTLSILLFLSCTQDKNSTSADQELSLLEEGFEQINTLKKDSVTSSSAIASTLQNIEDQLDDLSNDVERIQLIDKLALTHLHFKDTASFFRVNKLLKKYKHNPSAAKGVVWHLYNLEDYYSEQGKLALSYQILKDGFEEIKNIPFANKDVIYKPRLLYRIAYVEDNARLYEMSETTLTECLRMLDKITSSNKKKRDLLVSVYNQLGVAHAGMKDYKAALDFYSKSYEISKDLDDPAERRKHLFIYTNNMASIELRLNNFQKAYSNYSLLYSQFEDLNSDRFRVNCLVGLASSGFYSKNLSFKEAEEKYAEALELAKSSKKTHVPWVQYNWAKALESQGEKALAIGKMINAYELAKTYENTDRELKALRFLAIHGREEQTNYSKLYADLMETTWLEERNLQEKFSEIQYGVDKAEEELARESQAKQIWLGVSLALILIAFGGFVIIEQRNKNKELRYEKQQQLANEEIYNLMLSQRAKLEEGKQIAEKSISEEIHDGILGEMLGIRLILSGLNNSTAEEDVQKRMELIEQLQGIEEELRSISHQLNESAYRKVNEFALALEELLENICKPAKLEYRFMYPNDYKWDLLPGEIRIQLYRMLQGGLKNVVKHAQATEVQVEMKATAEDISLKLKDNGIGFTPSDENKGIGLKNLRSRIKKINGILDIKSTVGQGTELYFSLPHDNLFQNTPIPEEERANV